MKRIVALIFLLMSFTLIAQNTTNLADFQLSNVTSPAFLLVDETPTSIYTPQNLRALMVHSLQNLGENISIEVTPYFFGKNEDETYYKYMGIEHESGLNNSESDSGSDLRQDPFSGLWNNFTISAAYIKKEFNNLEGKNKTFSLGARTTLFRLFNKEKVYNNAIMRAKELAAIQPPGRNIRSKEAIKKYYEEKYKELDQEFNKTIKPIFQVDGALGYGLLFKDDEVKSATLKRLGTWVTANFSYPILNKGGKTKKNNYINIFAIGRYVEDGFSFTNNKRNTLFYRDFGAKVELEVGKFAFGYEYIKRNGAESSYKSLGNIKYIINKEITLSGGFGKDFVKSENGITFFGINWGLNLGNNKLELK